MKASPNEDKELLQKLKQRGGIFSESDHTTNLPKSLVRAQEKLLLQREKTPTKGKNTKGAIVREDRISKIEKRITKNENTVNAFEKIFSQFNIIQGAAFNPIGTGTNLLTGLLSRFLPAGMVLSIATLALQLWIDSYGKGGTRDPTKEST